jgi:uncharacterized protein (TIGR03118 family)
MIQEDRSMLRRALIVVTSLGLLLATAVSVDALSINAQNTYTVHNLVSDNFVPGTLDDPNLVNGWGLTAGPTTPWWVANNGTNTSTLYNGDGTPRSLVVSVHNAPTGAVFNGTADFVVSSGGASGPARFIFATEEGTILGWNPNVPAMGNTDAIQGTSTAGAIYKGLAIGSSGGANYLYATDFHHGRVDVFDKDFHPATLAGSFDDPGIPAGFAPFGIRNLNGVIYVTYAKQDADAEDEIAGPGLGYVSAFGTDGTFMARVASRGELNAPWGLAWAPGGTTFGRFSGHLLVGNFGDGRITGHRLTADGWEARGLLKGTDHRPISIDGLWGIGFGNGAVNGSGDPHVLYFAAGPDEESHGLFGSVSFSAP